MVAFWLVVWRVARLLWDTARDPHLSPVFGLVVAMLTIGSVFYWRVEGWSLFDSLYFCVVTLATVGFGDLSPQTTLGKSFTMGYIIIGAGTLGLFFNAIARRSLSKSGFLVQLTEVQKEIDQALDDSTTEPPA